MRKSFIATTVSGATYAFDGTYVKIESERSGHRFFSVWDMKEFSPEEMPETLSWTFLRSLPPVEELPKVGNYLYVAGREEWRISTRIVAIEELKE